MPHYTEIVRALSAPRFATVFAASPRRARDACLHRHRVRAESQRALSRPGARAEARVGQLHARLREVEDEEMCQELLRAWLMGRRPLLVAALDHMGIPHQDGLTDSDDVSRIGKLEGQDLNAMIAALANAGESWEVTTYLRFMHAPLPAEMGEAAAAAAPAVS